MRSRALALIAQMRSIIVHLADNASFLTARVNGRSPARNKKLLFAARLVSDETLPLSITGRLSHFIRQ